MTIVTKISRRAVLKGVTAAAVAPTFFVPRAQAQTPAFATAKHVLVLYARGGLRSHCLFNAVGSQQHNPYGTQPGEPGTRWSAGAVFGSADIQTQSFGTIPGFARITERVATLATVDLEPGETRPLVDHGRAVVRLGTGLEGSRKGLLSRVREVHPRYAEGSSLDNVPPIDIGNTTFARADDEYLPVRIADTTASVALRAIERDWTTEVRDRLDQRFASASPTAYHARLQRFADAKRDAFGFSKLLVAPRMDVRGAPAAEDAGITNAQLLEVFGDEDLADRGDPDGGPSWGPDVALAVRALGLGAPMVTLERNLYDTHSQEALSLPVRAADLVRQLAGLRFVLGRMPHPGGGVYWDHTVVTVLSEFNRNNTEVESGFNSGKGSDHVVASDHVTRNQAIPLLGGPIERAGLGGTQLGFTDDDMQPQDPPISMRRVYSTLLDLLGAPSEGFWPDAPLTELFE